MKCLCSLIVAFLIVCSVVFVSLRDLTDGQLYQVRLKTQYILTRIGTNLHYYRPATILREFVRPAMAKIDRRTVFSIR